MPSTLTANVEDFDESAYQSPKGQRKKGMKRLVFSDEKTKKEKLIEIRKAKKR